VGFLGGECISVSECSDLTAVLAVAAAAAAAAAAASSRFRLNNPGESSEPEVAGGVASEGKNLDGAAGVAGAAGEEEVAPVPDATGEAATVLGFTKKLRMSMVETMFGARLANNVWPD
jgi:hypothetical protein